MLYPLKFIPILKEKIWGGDYLYSKLDKGANPEAKVGESWEISCVDDNVSVVSDGVLKDNTLAELIEVYMGDLVGDKVYDKFGLQFPILIKFIDAQADLSVQVHPDDALANKKYHSPGKTEMWYVLEADKEAKIIAGFDKNASPLELQQALDNNSVSQLLRADQAQAGDVFFVPAGRIHTIGAGNVVIEIQQSSDITFRVYDFNRRDADGNTRQLHVTESLEALNYKALDNYKTPYEAEINKPANLTKCDHFTSNILSFDQKVGRDYYFLESFVVLICTEGKFDIEYEGGDVVSMKQGETVLLPAIIRECFFNPRSKQASFIETYLEL